MQINANYSCDLEHKFKVIQTGLRPRGSSGGLGAMCLLAATILFALILSPMHLHAQAASISGVVNDSSGALVQGADITLRNTETNVEQSTITGSQGSYSLINILPGRYLLRVVKGGFAVAQETGIVLSVSQAAVFNLVLKPGAAEETVTVTAATSAEQTSSATLGTVVETKSINDLPLNGRNFTELLLLAPGVSRINSDQSGSGGGGVSGNAIGSFALPAVNGQRNRSNMFLLDGANNLGSFFGNYNYEPIVDGILEFKVESHPDLAEYGQVTGGIVNVATKSGTNDFHGSVWEFLRNAKTDATNYFTKTVNGLHQNQYGVAIGGPVLVPHLYHGRNKTFFFFAYEGFHRTSTAQAILATATTAQLGGDFSNLLASGITIYNPYSTRPDPAQPGKYLRDPFPGNVIPSGSLSTAAVLYAKTLFPAPNATVAGGKNVVDHTPTALNDNNYSGRIDQAFGQRDQMFGRVSYYNEPATNSIFPGLLHSDVTSGYNIVVHEAHSFGPKAILELTFGRNIGSSSGYYTFANAPAGFASTLISQGFSTQFLTGFGSQNQSFVPLMLIGGYLGSSDNNSAAHQIADVYQFGGAFTRIIGRHTIKAGADFATNNQKIPLLGANETFATPQTSNLEAPANTGDALASFLLGVPSAATKENVNIIETHGWVDSAYVQDQFQVNRKLTANLGVRWDVSIWPSHGSDFSNGQGYMGDINLNDGTYILTAQPQACSSTVGAPCIPGGTLPAHVVVTSNKNLSLHATDTGDWQPRVGLAYHPFEKLTISAGYTRSYDEWGNITEATQAIEGNWPSIAFIRNVTLNQVTPTAGILDPLGLGSGTVFQPAATPFNNNQYYFNPIAKSPYGDQWNFGIQEGFGASTVISLAYVGSHNGHLGLAGLKNTATFAAAGTPAQVQSREPYPYMIPMYYDNQGGRSSYNSLQATLQKRMSNGLAYLLSYTWSKSLDIGCSTAYAACFVQDPNNIDSSRGISDFDLPQMLSASVVDELPIGQGRLININNKILDTVVGGWAINGILTLTSGTPFTVTEAGNSPNIGNTFVLANVSGNPVLSNPTPAKWFNTSALSAPPLYTFGNFGKNILRTDGFANLDLSVYKNFSLPEKATLRLQADAFNATNTVVFGAPGAALGTAAFGVVSSQANGPRAFQFAAKVQF